MIKQQELKDALHYCPETGIFTWRVDAGTKKLSGKKAGCVHATGYIVIKINGKLYSAHRLAFLYMSGEWPVDIVDHINGNGADNRWENLRQANKMQNACNSPLSSRNTSGVKGVCWNSGARKWQAQVEYCGARHCMTFLSIEDAKAWIETKRAELHGEFSHHG